VDITPYLSFDGTCAEAFRFYADVLHGEIEALLDGSAMPGGGEMAEAWKDRIMHASLRFGDASLAGADAPVGQPYEAPRGFSVTVTVDSSPEAERIFKAFSEKGTVVMPLDETFFAERFGLVTDRYGTPWMVIHPKPMPA
jgi:PhnB protein